MSEEKKRYTAKEMREAAAECYVVNPKTFSYTKIYLMLKQAADTEELLEEKQVRLDEALRILDETRGHRQVMLDRLNAVLKAIPSDCLVCQFSKCDGSCKLCKCAYDDMIRAARGEGVDKK